MECESYLYSREQPWHIAFSVRVRDTLVLFTEHWTKLQEKGRRKEPGNEAINAKPLRDEALAGNGHPL
jgi:hypothetical protein